MRQGRGCVPSARPAWERDGGRAGVTIALAALLGAVCASAVLANPLPAPRVLLDSWEIREPIPDESFFEEPIRVDYFHVAENAAFYIEGTRYDTVSVVLIPGCIALLNGQPWRGETADETSLMRFCDYVAPAPDRYMAPYGVPLIEELVQSGFSEREAGFRYQYEQWWIVRSLENCYRRARLAGSSASAAAEHTLAQVRTTDTLGLVDYDQPMKLDHGDLVFWWLDTYPDDSIMRIPLHMRRGETHMLSYNEWFEREVYTSHSHIDGGDVEWLVWRLRNTVSDTAGGGYLFLSGSDYPHTRARGDTVAAAAERQIEHSLASGELEDGPLYSYQLRDVLRTMEKAQ